MIFNRIQIDGVDKTGKDLIMKYVVQLSNHKYVIQARGILSQITYARIYNRDYAYRLEPYKHDIIILLEADLEDLKIRHKITGEPKIDIEKDAKEFLKTATMLRKQGLRVYRANTSHETPYEIAKAIVELMEGLYGNI